MEGVIFSCLGEFFSRTKSVLGVRISYEIFTIPPTAGDESDRSERVIMIIEGRK